MRRLKPPVSRADSGATLIEAALVLPIILFLIIGTVEIGLAFKNYLTAGAISREGARIAALAGDDAEADCAILRGIGELATASDLAKIDQIVVFKASPGTGNSTGTENVAVYVGGDPSDCEYQNPDGSESWQISPKGYDPTSRNTIVGNDASDPDLELVGVQVKWTHEWLTGLPPFNGSFLIDEQTITRVEPEAFDQS